MRPLAQVVRELRADAVAVRMRPRLRLCVHRSTSIPGFVSIVSILSYVIANLLQVDAFYEHLLGRLLGNMGRKDPDRLDGSGEKCLQNFVVGAGSECEGKLIRDIAWPESVRVVLIDRAGEEVVPTGSVKLQALDNLLLILDANKQDEVRERLWQMLGSSLTSNWRPKSSRLRRKIRKI